MNPGIQIRNSTKSFRTGEVLTPVMKGIDLDIAGGEMFFNVGPSGCGKTTLISVLCGTLPADAGEVMVQGHDLRKMRDSRITQFRAAQVGFVFQQFNLIPTLTAVQNVAVPLRLRGKSAKAAQLAAAEMLDRVGLAGRCLERLPPPSSLARSMTCKSGRRWMSKSHPG
jgi:putative ABC transport system ATP-binding protein